MPNLKKEKATAVGETPPADLRPPTSSSKDKDIEGDTNALATMCIQGGNLAENRPNR